MRPEAQLHQIGTVAERVGLSLRTIRHYEEVGLVIPSGRSAGGFRLYTDADIDRLAQVKVMKPLGFSLEETIELLALQDELSTGHESRTQRARLAELAERAAAACEQLGRQLELAREFTDSLQPDIDDRRPEPGRPAAHLVTSPRSIVSGATPSADHLAN